MPRPRVYVSGPISNGGTLKYAARLDNMYYAVDVGATLIKLGYAPLIPHLSVIIEHKYEGIDQDTWLAIDLPWVEAADALLRLPGASAGADKEEAVALASGVPVYHSIEELKDAINCSGTRQSC